jgi:Zn-dependent peptidase ImmA (M78 family)/transcriptional regulator with XRE-family HTH domain
MIGKRLKQARDALGLSLRGLEAAIQSQVSAQAIGKYERNKMMPSSTVLIAMAKVLNITPEFLLSTQEIELEGVDFRKDPQTGAKEERAVQAIVLDKVERYLEIEDILPNAIQQWRSPMRDEFTVNCIEDAEKAADTLREIWELGIDPIPNVAELLEEMGIKVVALDLPEEVHGSKAFVKRKGKDNVPVVVVNQKSNGERQRFTLVHELAHLVLRFPSMSDLDQEKAANRFAGAFLMAKEMMHSLLGENRTNISLGELAELKKIFKVSIAALVVRCSQLGILTKAAYGRLWAEIKALGWNSPTTDEPIKITPEIPLRMERLCLRAVAESIISESKAAELLQISVRKLESLLMAQGV